MTEALRMGKREWAMLALLSLLWGGSFFFIKVMVTQIPPLTLVMGRLAIAAAALNAALWVRGTPLPRGVGLWRSFIVMGLLNNAIPFTLIALARRGCCHRRPAVHCLIRTDSGRTDSGLAP